MVGLVKPDFSAGREERFFDFIRGLNEKDRIAIISHTDLDGIAAAKVADEVLNADYVRFANYDELNEGLIKELKDRNIKKAVFCDLATKDSEFFKNAEKTCDLLIIDHHKLFSDLNSSKTVFLNAEGFCASYLAYYLFSKTQNIEKYDWLVACACIADWLYLKNREWMSDVYEKYGEKLVLDSGIIEEKGRIFEVHWIISLALIYFSKNIGLIFNYLDDFDSVFALKRYADEVEKEIKMYVERFEKEKRVFGDNIFFEMKPKFYIKSMVVNEIAKRITNKNLIFVNCDDKMCYVSARRHDGKVDLDILLRKLVQGFENAAAGGHIKASGAHFPIKYYEELKKRVEKL